jgi:hypothetical protein
MSGHKANPSITPIATTPDKILKEVLSAVIKLPKASALVSMDAAIA